MNRRIFLQGVTLILGVPGAVVPIPSLLAAGEMALTVEPLRKSHQQWKALLSVAAFEILFEEQTEEPGSSELNQEQRRGTYICAACYLPLFESQHKYESGTGWPSFTQPIAGHVATRPDYSLLFRRTEYHCVRCGGHQGHIFGDGPLPRKERWCNNGLALQFVVHTDPLPPLRS